MTDFRIERHDVFHVGEIFGIDSDILGGKREIRFDPDVPIEARICESRFVVDARPNVVRFSVSCALVFQMFPNVFGPNGLIRRIRRVFNPMAGYQVEFLASA